MSLVSGNSQAIQRAAVFLDRDGVINRPRKEYVKTWSEFEFLPGALDALRRLATLSDRLIFVVTNQSCIGRGLTTWEAVEAIHRNMVAAVEEWGGRIDDIALCPHRPNHGCSCRKPEPGMVLALARKHGVSLADSYLVGNSLTDLLAAQQAGLRGSYFTSGVVERGGLEGVSAWRVKDLQAAVEHLVMGGPAHHGEWSQKG